MNGDPKHCNHDHVVQFYKTDAFLAKVVSPFIAAGLRRGGTALIVCTIEHRSVISAAMRSTELDLTHLQRRKALVWLDARSVMERLRSEDAAAIFAREIAGTVAYLDRHGKQNPVHIFGELVDLLWAEGKRAAAIEVEALWNTLSMRHNFSLLCAYRVSQSRSTTGLLRQICELHSHVLRPETSGKVRVLDDYRGQSARHGEREMVSALRRRDQVL